MNKTIHINPGHAKVLAKNGTAPYFSVNCPCQESTLTGKWFVDIFEYYPKSYLKLDSAELPYGQEPVIQSPQTVEIQSAFQNYRPSGIPILQPYFYQAAIRSTYGIDDPRLGLQYRTRELTISGNSLVYNQELYKGFGEWTYPEDNGDTFLISGNTNSDTTSSFVFNYKLSTTTTPISIIPTHGSGFLSSFILNNTDNNFTQDVFFEASSLIQFATKNDFSSDLSSYNYPILTAYYEKDGEDRYKEYVPVSGKQYTDTQLYISRIFKGSQEGYLFSNTEPSLFFDTDLYGLLYDSHRAPIIGSEDYQPLTGRTFYFTYQYGQWNYIVKKDNRYYHYSTYDNKTILEVPSSYFVSGTTNEPPDIPLPDQVIESGIISPNILTANLKNVYQVTLTYNQPQIIKVTSGLWGFDQNEYMSQEALSTISDGVIAYSELYDWYNHQTTPGQDWDDSVLIINPTTNLPQTGQCMLVGTEYWFPDDAQESYYDEDTGITTYYYWFYSLCFFRDYNTVTSTATMQMYKFGYNSNTGEYITGYFDTPKTVVMTVSGDNQQTGEYDKNTNWDSMNEFFCYIQGSTQGYHPAYQDLYFQMNEWVTQFPKTSGMVRYYIYKAPKWCALENVNGNFFNVSRNYIVTGNNYNSLRAYDLNNDYEEMTVLTSWWTSVDSDGSYNNALVQDNGDYWQVIDAYNHKIIPLTGGTYFNPEKSIAVDNPDRPPYWWYPFKNSSSDIMSGRYFLDDSGEPMILLPIYYDSQFGHIVNTLYADNWIPYDQAAILEPYRRNPAYFLAKDMINKHCYQFLNPLFRYEVIKRYYYNKQGEQYQNPTVNQYFTPDFIEEGHQISGQIVQSGYLYDPVHWSYGTQQNTVQWGGYGSDADIDYRQIKYTTATHRFVIPTPAQIADLNLNEQTYIDLNDLVNFGLYGSIYCQVLTGFWIRTKEDKNDQRTGIRKHGFVHVNMTPGYEYKFGYDLSNISQLNNQLSQDTSICYSRSGSNLIQMQVKDYWALVSASLQPTSNIKNFTISNFHSISYVRPISGNINL